MQVAVLTRQGFVMEERPMIRPAAHEVMIKVTASAICTGDVFEYQQRTNQEGELLLGHEGCGVIAEVGDAVKDLHPGQKVAALGMPAYGEYFVTEAMKIAPLPEGMDDRYVIGEPLACCVHAMQRVTVSSASKVAVLGGGFMGLVCMQLALAKGATEVLLIDPIAERRDIGMRLGAQQAFDPIADKEQLAQLSDSFDLVIEATGAQSALDMSTKLVRIHGALLLIGYHQSNAGMRQVHMQQWNYKGLDVINGHVRHQQEKSDALRQAVQLLHHGHIRTRELVTLYPFSDINRAFHDLAERKEGRMKIVLTMEDHHG